MPSGVIAVQRRTCILKVYFHYPESPPLVAVPDKNAANAKRRGSKSMKKPLGGAGKSQRRPSLAGSVTGGAGKKRRESIAAKGGGGAGGGGKKQGGATKGGKQGKGKGSMDKKAYKTGKRNADSDSDYSYRSVYSAGGTRHVRRRKRNADGTYGDSESYHSSQDEDGDARRRKRRRDREHGANSAHSYYSVISEGGTRHVRRRVRNEDGTYGDSESYHSGDTSGDSDDSDSDYSYASERSEGGTRYETKRKRIRDEKGRVIGHEQKEILGEAVSDADSVRTRRGSVTDKDTKEKLLINDTVSGMHYASEGNDTNTVNDPEAQGQEVWPGTDPGLQVPEDFSDVTTDDDVDLSKMTAEEKEEYFREKEKRRLQREKKRREKYGSKYDEIMKRREAKRLEEMRKRQEAQENAEKDDKIVDRRSSLRRQSTNLDKDKLKERPRSMVTYEKGPPRDLGHNQKIDNREIGLSHDTWGKVDKMDTRSRRGSDSSQGSDTIKSLVRERTMLTKLPSIPQGKMYTSSVNDSESKRPKYGKKRGTDGDETTLEDENTTIADDLSEELRMEEEAKKKLEELLEVGADGKIRLLKKKINLNDLDKETLRRLGIDSDLSKVEIAKRLKLLFGDDIKITDGDDVIGTKGVSEFDPDMTDDQLAEMEDLDISTLKGKRRVNILFKRGGSALRKHWDNILSNCNLRDDYAKDIDERDSAIDFLNHYRLVDPVKLDGYAKAFVVEDADTDAVINSMDTRVALGGVDNLPTLTNKQLDYVFKILHIDEATQVTFRMFAVITAMCERVTTMDALSKHLLDICNLADIERKLELYLAMFYQNIPSYRNTNFVTSESLKIELIAGGLNWTQQDFIMKKMVASPIGEISFLDYMCYIPLFLSMHDNICYNPLDMSNEKYQVPPRKRPPSAQRDMNPLGQPLTKSSDFLMKKQGIDLIEGKLDNSDIPTEKVEILSKYAKLPDIRQMLRPPKEFEDEDDVADLIY